MRAVFRFCIIGMLALWLCSDARAQETIRIIVFGDSLTSGYELQPEQAFPARLKQKLMAVGFSNIDVSNMSVSDETTNDAVKRLDALLEQQPDIVVVELGTDDARRGISVDVIFNNMVRIASKLKQAGIYTILIGNKAPSEMGYSYGSRFEQIYARIAQSFKMPLYPFALDGIAGNPDLSLADGVHPNAKGVQFMMEQVYPLVDAAVRWKWEVQQYYRQWQMQQNQSVQPAPPPPDPSPAP